MLAAKFDLAVLQLSLGYWFWLKLPLDSTVSVSLLTFGSYAIQVEGRLVFVYGTFNIKRVDEVLSFKSWDSDIVIDSKVNVFFHFLQGHWWCSEGLFVLLVDSLVDFSVDALVLYVIVEALFVRFDCKILGNVLFVGVDFMLSNSG